MVHKKGLCLVVLGSVLCVLLVLSACSREKEYFNWDNLQKEGQYYYYSKEGKPASLIGVDVSEVQGIIDWTEVVQDEVSFAYIRAAYQGMSEGELYEDDYFAYNFEGAKQAGLKCGIYFYSQAITVEEAQEDARYLLELMEREQIGTQDLELPIAYDFEYDSSAYSRASTLTKQQNTDNMRAFCDVLTSSGYKCSYYGDSRASTFFDTNRLKEYPFWYAEYGENAPATINMYMWQYSNNGLVSGISTRVDLNVWFTEQ